MVKKVFCFWVISVLCGVLLCGCEDKETQATQQLNEVVSEKSSATEIKEENADEVSSEDDYAARLAAAKAQKPDGILSQAEMDAIRNGGTLEDAAKYEKVLEEAPIETTSVGYMTESDDTKHYGEYDEKYIKYVDNCNEMCVCQFGADIISLVDKEKGDLPVYYYNKEGYRITEGVTDCLYGDSFIIDDNWQSKVIEVNDNGDGTATVTVIDNNGQIIEKIVDEYSDSFYEVSEMYKEGLACYCTKEITSQIVGEGVDFYPDDETDNGRVQIVNSADGVRVSINGENEIAFFENRYPGVSVDSQLFSLEGCLYGDFLVLCEYSGDNFGDMNIYLYLLILPKE